MDAFVPQVFALDHDDVVLSLNGDVNLMHKLRLTLPLAPPSEAYVLAGKALGPGED